MTSSFDLAYFERFLFDLARALRVPSRDELDAATSVSHADESTMCALKALVHALASQATDAPPSRPEYGDEPATVDFPSACTKITDAVRREVGNVITRHHRDLLDQLLDRRFPDILAIVGKERDENAHSSVLRWLLDPVCAPTIAKHALGKLVQNLQDPEWRQRIQDAIDHQCLSVRREVALGSEGALADKRDRIDLLISGPTFLLAVENKIASPEHDGQTPGYWDWLQAREKAVENFKVAGIFLTPFSIRAQCENFISVSYLHLLACLLDVPQSEPLTPSEEAVLSGYVRTLRRHVLGPELKISKSTSPGT